MRQLDGVAASEQPGQKSAHRNSSDGRCRYLTLCARRASAETAAFQDIQQANRTRELERHELIADDSHYAAKTVGGRLNVFAKVSWWTFARIDTVLLRQ